jgi:hypothetical protein
MYLHTFTFTYTIQTFREANTISHGKAFKIILLSKANSNNMVRVCVCVCVCVVVCGAHERAEFTSFSRSTLTRMPTLFSLHNTTLHYTSLHPHFTVQGPDASLRRDILIATPMRLVHALTNTGLDLSNVRYLVLDEADRLFEMGKGVCCVCERV